MDKRRALIIFLACSGLFTTACYCSCNADWHKGCWYSTCLQNSCAQNCNSEVTPEYGTGGESHALTTNNAHFDTSSATISFSNESSKYYINLKNIRIVSADDYSVEVTSSFTVLNGGTPIGSWQESGKSNLKKGTTTTSRKYEVSYSLYNSYKDNTGALTLNAELSGWIKL